MNTVDALKDLYKTLCGKDYAGDPNPTDAEMISAIAKDASSGGSGSGGGSPITVIELDFPEEISDNDIPSDLENLQGVVVSHTWEQLRELERTNAPFVVYGKRFSGPTPESGYETYIGNCVYFFERGHWNEEEEELSGFGMLSTYAGSLWHCSAEEATFELYNGYVFVGTSSHSMTMT